MSRCRGIGVSTNRVGLVRCMKSSTVGVRYLALAVALMSVRGYVGAIERMTYGIQVGKG